tara:strand:- start:29 stop:1231 length:1203 start_codon:yes stop_codon:yes gene_type:complete
MFTPSTYKKKRNKRGQAGGASGLIALILLFIILYILFLSPEDRADLLDDDFTSNSGSSSGSSSNRSIFTEAIGRVDYISQRDFDKPLPNIFLDERRDATVLKKFNAIYVKNGLFDKKNRELTFSLDQKNNLENIQLVFSATKHKGILTMTFNGEVVFESELSSFNAPPITIDNSLLENDNKISFSVSGVGLRFWRTNEYNLEDIRVIANIVDTSGQKSQSLFTLTATEFFNFEEGNLRFIPYCGNQDTGKLTVLINNREVYSSIPVCDDPYIIPLAPNILNSGANRISFSTEKGSFSVEQIRVRGELKDQKGITRFFDLDNDDYDRIRDNNADAFLVINFVDDREDKEAEISVNGHRTILDQRDREYRKRINQWIESDNNYIAITPLSTLYISNIEVEVS